MYIICESSKIVMTRGKCKTRMKEEQQKALASICQKWKRIVCEEVGVSSKNRIQRVKMKHPFICMLNKN